VDGRWAGTRGQAPHHHLSPQELGDKWTVRTSVSLPHNAPPGVAEVRASSTMEGSEVYKNLTQVLAC
jgi:hypothetical protein